MHLHKVVKQSTLEKVVIPLMKPHLQKVVHFDRCKITVGKVVHRQRQQHSTDQNIIIKTNISIHSKKQNKRNFINIYILFVQNLNSTFIYQQIKTITVHFK